MSFFIRESRMYGGGMVLEPQDIVVVLKLCGHGQNRPPFTQIAADLAMSPSEVHGALKRAAGHLVHGPEMNSRPNVSALREFSHRIGSNILFLQSMANRRVVFRPLTLLRH